MKADHRQGGGGEGWWLAMILLGCLVLLYLAVWGR